MIAAFTYTCWSSQQMLTIDNIFTIRDFPSRSKVQYIFTQIAAHNDRAFYTRWYFFKPEYLRDSKDTGVCDKYLSIIKTSTFCPCSRQPGFTVLSEFIHTTAP